MPRKVIIKRNRGKSMSLHWVYNDDFLCELSLDDAKYLRNDLDVKIEVLEQKWKRKKK